MKINPFYALIGLLLLTFNAFGSQTQTVWNSINHIAELNQFTINNDHSNPLPVGSSLYHFKLSKTNSFNELKFLQVHVDFQNTSHIRYDQYYQGIPVWGQQLIFHIKKNEANEKNVLVTGMFVSDLQNDIRSIQPIYVAKTIGQFAQITYLSRNYGPWRISPAATQLIIYPDEKTHTAKLAYTVTFFAHGGRQNKLYKPFYIIDANNKTIYQSWDDLHHDIENSGQGNGGNTKDYQSGTYKYWYGSATAPEGWSVLGKFDVNKIIETCLLQNTDIEIASLHNNASPFQYVAGTIIYSPTDEEADYPVFSYSCPESTSTNLTDGDESPVNSGYSPNNDTMYGAEETVNMLKNTYHFSQPLGSAGVMRIYTHYQAEDAYALSEGTDGTNSWHQQIVLGNGADDLYPSVDACIVSHELGHVFTDHNSNLTYANQSGGINESFSDTTCMAIKDYIHSQYSWFNTDWEVGKLSTKVDGSYSGGPIRYLDTPTLDGSSIDNAANYTAGMDPHYSSGVYNKAFYLLGTSGGWSIEKAFTVYANANADYWIPASTFNYAACGVIQEAHNRGYGTSAPITAFNGVGVKCKIGQWANL